MDIRPDLFSPNQIEEFPIELRNATLERKVFIVQSRFNQTCTFTNA